MSAQAIRAILLASATTTKIGGLCISMRASQDPSGASRFLTQLTTADAPIIRRRRRSRCPIFDILPGLGLAPVDHCRGVKPIHAAKSRPRLKVSAGGANASNAVAMTGPTPGIVIKRLATVSVRERTLLIPHSNTRRNSFTQHRVRSGPGKMIGPSPGAFADRACRM